MADVFASFLSRRLRSRWSIWVACISLFYMLLTRDFFPGGYLPISRKSQRSAQAASAHLTSSSPRGVVFIVEDRQQAHDIRVALCTAAFQRSMPATTRAPPIASQEITIAHCGKSGLALSTEIEKIIASIEADDRCFRYGSSSTVPSQRRLQVRIIPTSATLQFQPIAVISAANSPQSIAFGATLGCSSSLYQQRRVAGQPICICLPQRDLKAAGWILTLSGRALQAWHTPTWKILIITNDRVQSLRRLLLSLSRAHFFGSTVDLYFKCDALADEATRLEVARFSNPDSPDAWKHGHSHISHRYRQAGLITNIVEAWYPAGNNEYAFFLEDDVEVSPFFFGWAKMAILSLRYGDVSTAETGQARNIYAVSMYQVKTSELDPRTGRILWNASSMITKEAARPGGQVFPANTPFLLQVPCSWGAVYFPEHWREFHRYLIEREKQQLVPMDFNVVWPKVVSNGWRTSWKRYFIELAYLRGYQTLYPNYPDFVSLSTNHVELGHHIDLAKQELLRPLQHLPLMQDDVLLQQLPDQRLPQIEDLPAFDLWGNFTSDSMLVSRGWERQQHMYRCDLLSESKLDRPASDFRATSLFGCPDHTMPASHNETNWKRFMTAKWRSKLDDY